ncbi:9194_t:CDS:2, partial [Funneliformis geosporum]
MTVHWKDDPELLKQICLIDVETAPDSRLITIICGSQVNLLKAFALCSKKLGVLEWMFNHMSIKPSGIEKILKWQYQYNTIKVNDRQFHSKHHKILGCVAIDVQPCFMGFHPKAEKNSLAFYLNESGLERKFPGTYVFPLVKGLKNKRSVTGLDFALLYLCLIITYNLSPDKIILSRKHAKSLKESKHRNQAEMKGLYSKVLEELRIKRNLLESHLALLNDKKEELEKKINLVEKRGIVITDTLKSKYSSVVFNIACLDAKQLALKVYMNTFYALAGGVISAGQRNIKLIANLVGSKKFSVKYGDTDSLYLVCPEECFQKCDETYNNGNGILKEEYWSRIVNISMEVIERLRDEVNDFLRNDNRSSYLKMAYEKVLFLVVFTGKKKYYGKKVMDESMKTLMGWLKLLCESLIKITRGLTHKPYLYEIPEPGELFEYIVVENDSSQRVGDKMEYSEVVRRLGKKIDISYYLKTVVGLCAQFINYDKSFQPSSEIVLEALKKLKNGNK